MFKVKTMFDRNEGYKIISCVKTEDEAKEIVKAIKFYHQKELIDVYYTCN